MEVTGRGIEERMIVGSLALAALGCIAGIVAMGMSGREIPAILTSTTSFVVGALAGALHTPGASRSQTNGTQPQSTPNPPNGVPPGR